MPDVIRQGDVALIPRVPLTTEQRAKAKPVVRDQNRVVLAYGEVTGHAHAIHDVAVEQVELTDGERVIVVDQLSALVHEEHNTLDIPAGTYSVIRQREYTPEGLRDVQD